MYIDYFKLKMKRGFVVILKLLFQKCLVHHSKIPQKKSPFDNLNSG